MSTNRNVRIFQAFALLALLALTSCASNFEPAPLALDHPASVQAQEVPRTRTQRLTGSDAITRKTTAQLARQDVPNPNFQSGGMSHDMSSMGGMDKSQMEGTDHSKMQGMDMNKQPAVTPASPPAGMDHSKMPGMTMPATRAAPPPASKEAAEMEMKKTSDEMKKLSDETKAKSDAEKSPKKPPSEAAHWTCVMHPEIHQDKPGQCPKCGMTLVKKEGAPK